MRGGGGRWKEGEEGKFEKVWFREEEQAREGRRGEGREGGGAIKGGRRGEGREGGGIIKRRGGAIKGRETIIL